MNNVYIRKRATYHHGNLRDALVRVALRAIADDGPDRFTLRDVARRAGVSPGAVYRHFRDKDELVAAVAGECADRLAATVAAELARAPDDPLEQFRHVGIAHVQFAVAHPEHFRALALPGIAARLPEPQRAREAAAQAEQQRALAAAQAAGTLAPLPLDALMLAASALVHGLAHQIVAGRLGPVDATRATELATAATSVLGHGLLPRASEPACAPAAPPPRRKRPASK